MERGLFNISDELVHTLLPMGSGSGGVKKIRVCNTRGDRDVSVRLFLDDGTNQTSIVQGLHIPLSSALEIDDISFDNSVLGLKVQLTDLGSVGTTVDVDIILK